MNHKTRQDRCDVERCIRYSDLQLVLRETYDFWQTRRKNIYSMVDRKINLDMYMLNNNACHHLNSGA